MEKKVKSTRKWSLPMTGLFALFCTLLVVGGLFLTQVILLQNSQQWGNHRGPAVPGGRCGAGLCHQPGK